jgi:hypothetical protein
LFFSPINVSVDIQIPEDPPLIEETLVLCPMSHEQFACSRHLLTQAKNGAKHALERQGILDSLLQIATHPVLVASERHCDIDFASGKFTELQSLVDSEFGSWRTVAVVCSSPMLFRLVCQYFSRAELPYTKFDPKYQEKIVGKLTAIDGPWLIVMPSDSIDFLLNNLNVNTIILLDPDWNPALDADNVLGWFARATVHSPRFYRLLSQGGVDQILFHFFWGDPSLTRAIVAEDEGLFRSVMLRLAPLAFREERFLVSRQMLAYSVDSLSLEAFPENEPFWKAVVPDSIEIEVNNPAPSGFTIASATSSS